MILGYYSGDSSFNPNRMKKTLPAFERPDGWIDHTVRRNEILLDNLRQQIEVNNKLADINREKKELYEQQIRLNQRFIDNPYFWKECEEDLTEEELEAKFDEEVDWAYQEYKDSFANA